MLTNKKIILLLILTLLLTSCFNDKKNDNKVNNKDIIQQVTGDYKKLKAVGGEVKNEELIETINNSKDHISPAKPNIIK